MNWLYHWFPNRLISKRRETETSSHSPYLQPPDFYVLGFPKDMYENNAQTIAELKEDINQKIRAISKKEFLTVIGNFDQGIQMSSAQWRSFGTRPVTNASFELNISNDYFIDTI